MPLHRGTSPVLMANQEIAILIAGVKIRGIAIMGFSTIGSLAISAIPPLNGFVSEWFTYQAMFSAAFMGGTMIKAFAAFAAVALAVTGALAVTCFVKAYGVTFLGVGRSDAALKAKEVPASMTASMVILSIVCIFLGLGAPLCAPVLEGVAASVLGGSAVPRRTGRWCHAGGRHRQRTARRRH